MIILMILYYDNINITYRVELVKKKNTFTSQISSTLLSIAGKPIRNTFS